MRRFKGVATRCLDSYLGGYRAIDRTHGGSLKPASMLALAIKGWLDHQLTALEPLQSVLVSENFTTSLDLLISQQAILLSGKNATKVTLLCPIES